jgi:hypothetical protein
MDNNCANHKKEVAGISDMKVLAEMIGDLHYESLSLLFIELRDKLLSDAANDRLNKRFQVSNYLSATATNIHFAAAQIESAWHVSKPYMTAPPSPINEQEK